MTIWLLAGYNRDKIMFIIITMFQDHDNITYGGSIVFRRRDSKLESLSHWEDGSKMINTDDLLTKVDREKSPISITHIVQWKSNLNEG